MKKLDIFSAVLLSATLIAADTNAQSMAPFTDRAVRTVFDTQRIALIPNEYRALSLDVAQLEAALANAKPGAPLTLELPMPSGESLEFEVFPTSNMAPELQASYPDIRSYRGTLISTSAARANWVSARIDTSPLGFSAMIFDDQRVVMIEPTTLGRGVDYLSYDRATISRASSSFSCGVLNDASAEITGTSLWKKALPTAPKFSTGQNLRIYRLAVAATGEFSAFFGGTVAGSLAGINAAMNRVNEVYRREFALQMVLVANNDQIIYLNGNTDPYTNNNGSTMLGQNQATLDSIIGNANYDIGHVFSTGGGGVASLNSPCQTGSKARGVTGSGSPTGDAFWIDYVAHEMGHQWGGPHTFNGNAGNCSGGNRSAGFAYEPGSGSTIQAYAGICAPQDLQPNSDPWFHTSSLLSIQNYLNGGGGSCGQSQPSGNQIPTANAGPDRSIPAKTPFALTATAVDPEGRPLLYLFEQYNLGPAAAPDVDNGSSPITRSFNPSADPTRTFPARRTNGTAFLGEILPQVARTNFQFRLTVRDQATQNGLNIGATTSDDVSLTVVDTGAAFAVQSQDTAGIVWQAGTPQSITWAVAGTNAAPISCANVEIALSTDAGASFNRVLLASTPNDGTEIVTAPSIASTRARVRVRCADNIFFAINSVNFETRQELFSDGFEDR